MGDKTKIVLDFLDFPPFLSTFKLLYCTCEIYYVLWLVKVVNFAMINVTLQGNTSSTMFIGVLELQDLSG